MKYYLCINEIEEKKENSDVNWFIQYTFGYYKAMDNYSNDFLKQSFDSKAGVEDVRNYYNEKQYGFRKNYIYHTTSYSDDYIVDDNGKSHKVLSVVPKYFVPFEFVVDKRIKKIQEKKKDDLIEITPSYIDLNGEIKYHIVCEAKVGSCRTISQVFDTSQYDGVIRCYKRMRVMSPMYRLWHDIVRYNKCLIK